MQHTPRQRGAAGTVCCIQPPGGSTGLLGGSSGGNVLVGSRSGLVMARLARVRVSYNEAGR